MRLGNNMEAIAKFLDHSSLMTTQKYYVKYSRKENMNGMIAPWFDKKVEDKIEVRECLMNDQNQDESKRDKKGN